MATFDLTRFDHLTEAEVLRRIGALLATALVRNGRLRSAGVASPADGGTTPPVDDPARLVGDATEQQIVRYLALTGPASPRELSTSLGLARRTVARKLARLRAAGLCVVSGETKAAHYRLRTDCSRN